MPGPGGEFLAELTIAPIFDDAIYLSEALLLPVNENEDDLDAQLAMSARESGIEDPYRFLSPDAHHVPASMSTTSLQSEQRSSMSIRSQETQSTTFTSPASRTSRDNPSMEQSPVLRSPPSLARASLSLDRGPAIDPTRPSIRHSHSSSGFSAANSVLSTTSSARKPSTRKHKRGSGLFSVFRKDSSTGPSSSRHSHHSKAQDPSLEPSHSLSKYAIRVHVRDALGSKNNASPTHGVRSLTRAALETVLIHGEPGIGTDSPLRSPASRSLRDSGYSEDGISTIELSQALDAETSRRSSFTTPILETTSGDNYDLNLTLANEAFKSMKAEQRQQFERVALFESNQRKALSSYHQWSLKRLSSQLETSKAEKMKQHDVELERLDEFQINVEHDLRKAHATETQNVATALKYMDAYCSGANPTNPELTHTVTDEDRKKLERQRMTQEKLPAKHESAINVLRAKQERDTKLKLQKQQRELQHLDDQYEKEKNAEELQYAKDSSRLDKVIQTRRTRIIQRWDLKFEIWRKDWESQHGTTLNAQLPHEDWPETLDMEAPISQSSSLALYAPLGA